MHSDNIIGGYYIYLVYKNSMLSENTLSNKNPKLLITCCNSEYFDRLLVFIIATYDNSIFLTFFNYILILIRILIYLINYEVHSFKKTTILKIKINNI